jgi:WD40 repeat protein
VHAWLCFGSVATTKNQVLSSSLPLFSPLTLSPPCRPHLPHLAQDESGKIRIWDTTQEEHKLKYEYPVLGGKVNDIMWTEDSKRIVVGGGGGVPGRALLWDSGSSCGEILGHTKAINGVAVKQTRPFRVVTASEDGDQGIFNGPPFKFDHMNHEAVGSYLNMVRYNSDDSLYVSVSAKGKAFIYDGKDGTFKGELNGGAEQAHTAGIYGTCALSVFLVGGQENVRARGVKCDWIPCLLPGLNPACVRSKRIVISCGRISFLPLLSQIMSSPTLQASRSVRTQTNASLARLTRRSRCGMLQKIPC